MNIKNFSTSSFPGNFSYTLEDLIQGRNKPRLWALPPYLHHGHVLLGRSRLDFAGHFYHCLHQPGDVLVHFVIGAVQVGRGRGADLLRLDLQADRGCWISCPQQMGLGPFPAGKGSGSPRSQPAQPRCCPELAPGTEGLNFF